MISGKSCYFTFFCELEDKVIIKPEGHCHNSIRVWPKRSESASFNEIPQDNATSPAYFGGSHQRAVWGELRYNVDS